MAGTSALGAEQFNNNNLTEWDEGKVNEWLSFIGFPQYHQQIIDNGISGEILSLLDHEGLKEVGVHSVGQRLAILREAYYLKVAHGITIEPEHYVPPSEATRTSGPEGMSLDRLHELMKELGERTKVLEHENRRLADSLNFVMDQLAMVKTQDDSEGTLRHQVSFGPAINGHGVPQTPGGVRSNIRLGESTIVESPQTSPVRLEHDASLSIASQVMKSSKPPHTPHAYEQSRTPTDKLHTPSHFAQSQQQAPSTSSKNAKENKETHPSASNAASAPAENQFKSFKVSLEDPCWKVLPAALKKYKINDDWRKYVMFICHGSTERCLSYDEKPLLLFQKLKDANKNPVFMLRHIKDIRSPIAVAQQKQTQRQRDNPAGTSSGPLTPGGSRSGTAPTPSSSTGASGSSPAYSRNTRLHQPPVLHPISAQAQAVKSAEANAVAGPQGFEGHSEEPSPHPDISESLAASGSDGTSYAIAIYPYTAEQDDEFDVAVDDTFIIRSREKGWWVVQRDVAGTGVPSQAPEDAPKWIPAGCLLETTLPPSQAMQETRVAIGSSLSPGVSPISAMKKPILPPHIVSTSFPGITLMAYGDKGDYELSLARGDVLRVFKRYNHWSYAIKEETGERGWVPSWFIGKHTPGSTGIPPLVPPTPTSGATASSSTSNQQQPQQHGVTTPGEVSSAELLPFSAMNGATAAAGMNGSPMSQAFPTSSQQPAAGPYMRSAVTLI